MMTEFQAAALLEILEAGNNTQQMGFLSLALVLFALGLVTLRTK